MSTVLILVALRYIVCFGSILCLGTVFRLAQQYAFCREELSPPLWDGALPKKMFPKGIYRAASCGYDKIEIITANSSNVAYVPPIISKCTNLNKLWLARNEIRSLPVELLTFSGKKITHASLVGNPVATKIDVSNFDLGGHFPTPFICKFMSYALETVAASNCSIRHIDDCIGKFTNLQRLDVSHNSIVPYGISAKILSIVPSTKKNAKLRGKLRAFDIAGNPVASHLSFHKRNIDDIRIDKNGDIGVDFSPLENFILRFFNGTLQELDLSKNKLEASSNFFINIWKHCKQLLILNISYNKVTELTSTHNYLNPFVEWKNQMNLQTLDASFNPIVKIDSWLVRYFEAKKPLASVNITGNKITLLPLLLSDLTKFPFAVMDQLVDINTVLYTDNKIDNFPNLTYFCKFTSLKSFHYNFPAENETLRSIPPCFGQFSQIWIMNAAMGSKANFSWP